MWHSRCAAAPPRRAQRWHVWFPNPFWLRRGAQTQAGSGPQLSERSEFCGPPPESSTAGCPQRSGGTQTAGSPFFCLLFFGEAKKSRSAAGPRPGLGRQEEASPSTLPLHKAKKKPIELFIDRQPVANHPNPSFTSRITKPKRSPLHRQLKHLHTHLAPSLAGSKKEPLQHSIEPQRIQIALKPFERSLGRPNPPLQRGNQRLAAKLGPARRIQFHRQRERKVPPHPVHRRHQHPHPRPLAGDPGPQRKAPYGRLQIPLHPIGMPVPQPRQPALQPLVPHGTERFGQPAMREVPHPRQLAEPTRQLRRGKNGRRRS